MEAQQEPLSTHDLDPTQSLVPIVVDRYLNKIFSEAIQGYFPHVNKHEFEQDIFDKVYLGLDIRSLKKDLAEIMDKFTYDILDMSGSGQEDIKNLREIKMTIKLIPLVSHSIAKYNN